MCGRFALAVDSKVLNDAFSLSPVETENQELTPSYNIAPSQQVAGIYQDEQAVQHLRTFRWGLIPHWAKDSAIGARMINARSETVATKPSFKSSLRRRRCVIPANGFYEWKKAGKTKIPYFFQRQDRSLMAFAGLWDAWEGPDGQVVSCSILTTAANGLVGQIHPWMPVILSAKDTHLWLDTTIREPADLMPLYRPFPEEELAACQVDPLVNNPSNNNPSCWAPATGVSAFH